jgi:hypothetical protein
MAGLASINIKFLADLTGFSTNMQNANRKISKMGKNMQKVGRNLSVGLTAPILAFGAISLKSWDKQEKAIAQVNAGLLSTGNAVGFTSEQLQKMASDLQNTSLFGDEEILQDATAQLLTFTNIAGDQFARTQQAAIDLSTRLGGDLKSASIQLGKALNDPVANLSALSRSGIQFSKEQKAVIKSLADSNRLADAQTIILDELARQYGGAGEAASKAGLGGLKQLQNSLGDLMEDFGAIIAEAILPFVAKIKSLVSSFKALSPETKKFIVILAGVAAAVGPLLLLAGTILPALVTGFTLLTGPIGLIIAGLTAVGVIIYKNWEPIKAELVALANYFVDLYNESVAFRIAIEYVALQFKTMFTVVKFVFKNIYTIITGVVRQIVNQFKAMGDVFKGALTLDPKAIIKGVKDFGVATKENLAKVIDGFKINFGDAITDVSANMKTAIENVANKKYKTVLEVEVAPVGANASILQSGGSGGVATRPQATALDTSSFAVGIQPLADGVLENAEVLDGALTGVQDRFVDFSSEVSGILTETSANVLAGFGVMIAGLMDGSLTMGDVAGGLMKTIGGLAIQLGEAAIKIGVGMLAIKAAFKNPFTAIAAGIALVAIGTLISNAGNITSGGGNYAGAFADGGMVGGSSFSGDKLFARVNSGEMILNQRQQGNLGNLISPASSMLNVVLGGELTADAGRLKVVLDKYDTRKNRTS